MKFNGEISVTYTGGVLRPDQRIDAPDGTQFSLSPRADQPTPESRQRGWALIERIRQEGLIRLRGMRWTRDDLYDRR